MSETSQRDDFMPDKLNVKVIAWALAVFGIFNWFIAVIWHGFLKQPSIIQGLYPDWNFLGGKELFLMFIGLFIGGLIYGAVFAWIYNWVAKKVR